jgi:hypothetical protein
MTIVFFRVRLSSELIGSANGLSLEGIREILTGNLPQPTKTLIDGIENPSMSELAIYHQLVWHRARHRL